VKFSFIHAEKAHFPVAALCRVLGVSRQGYYAHVAREPSARVQRDAELQERVRAVHDGSKQRYGSPRVLAELKREGFAASKRRVERAMRSLGLSARAPRRFRITTTANERHLVAPNRLARDFTASRPNERWVTDISYIWTNEGWAYVAVILDLFSRAVVGWALDTTLSTRLAKDALEMALARRNAGEGLLHHSDRGCQYTSHEYRDLLDPLGITVSMSRKGNCWDNAVAESFFATLKRELIRPKRWSNRLELRTALFEYIEVFYNRRRLHSAIGYKTPSEVEHEYDLTEAA
jgi:transposase InsO family protein